MSKLLSTGLLPANNPTEKMSTKNTIIENKFVCQFTKLKLFSYAGSKDKFKNHFHNTLNKIGVKKVGTYIEAFAGSLASMFHNLEKISADKIVINDFNIKIINLYKQIQQNPEQVFQAYKMIEDKYKSLIPKNAKRVQTYPKEKRDEVTHLSDFFKYMRTHLNRNDANYTNAATWLFIMNHNFKGMYNENKKGEANISFNWSTKDVNIERIRENIFNLSHLFNQNNVVFENLDVDTLISKYNDHDTFIYLDPPYINTKIQYNQSREGSRKKKSTNSFQDVSTHLKMIETCKKYKYVMYSNNHDEEFIEVFDDYLNFNRKSQISTTKSKKLTLEILAYKVNKKIPQLSIELLNKKLPLKVNNDLVVKKVSNGQDIITTGSICSGGGASEDSMKQLGFNESNHRNLFMCEWDEKVSDVYKMNFKSENNFRDF